MACCRLDITPPEQQGTPPEQQGTPPDQQGWDMAVTKTRWATTRRRSATTALRDRIGSIRGITFEKELISMVGGRELPQQQHSSSFPIHKIS